MEFYKSAYDRNQLSGTSSPAAQAEQSEIVSEYENDMFMNHHKTRCICMSHHAASLLDF